MTKFQSFHGIITAIEDFWTGSQPPSGCYKLYTLSGDNNVIINFVISPNTYFVDYVRVGIGDMITGFYDMNAPVPLIYPPRYSALIVTKENHRQSVTVDYFDNDLINSTNALKLNIGARTPVILKNNQFFNGKLGNRNLIVVYSFLTRSIPAQTTPEKVIVICED